jgi:TolB-like protein/Tfp pilus assembly protein PilF
MRLVSELRRRNVLRMAVLYAVAAWLIMQAAEVIIDLAHLPDWIGPTTLGLLAVGFPIALIFSWFYEITPEGISLEKDVDPQESITQVTGRRLDFIVISLLCAGLILFAYDKWWIGPPPEKSIAVLAFANMSGDPDQEYFSDGISEELLNLLAQIPELRVISRSSSFSFKGKDIAIPTVAKQLNVAHVLEGSVRKMGNRVRITAQLIEASSDSHLWSQSYDRELDDIFAVQDEIAAAISDALKVKLALVAGGAVRPTVIKATNTDAYDAYLQGRELIHHRNREPMEEAVRHLERSLRLDNNFAPAHAQLAIATMLLTSYVASPREEARRTANRHLDRAQELEPDLAEAHGGRALLAIYAPDSESTIEHARKALASNPNYIDAMNWLLIALGALGRYEEADPIRTQMLVTDPLSIIGRANYIEWLSDRGRIEEAHDMADQLLAQSPAVGYSAHAETSLWSEGKIAESLSWALRAPAGNSYAMWAFAFVGEYDEARRINARYTLWVDVIEGRWEEAIRATQSNMQLYPNTGAFITLAAEVLFLAGRIDEALPLYERALDFVPEGRPMPEPISLLQTMWLAHARRKAGDEAGAQAAAQIVRQDHAARRAAGEKNQDQDSAEAMLAAFEHNPDHAVAALKSAIQRGLRFPIAFDIAIFEDLRDEPRFVALQQELDAILAAEHDKLLQLICFNNPVPDNWQPLPETCEGVEEQRRL